MGEHQLTIRDYVRHTNLTVTNKDLQATAKSKRHARDKLVKAILPSGSLSQGTRASGGSAASARNRTPPGRLCFDSLSRRTVIICVEAYMYFEGFSFGSIRIDGVSYEHDVVIDRGEVRKRKKKASKRFRDLFGHTPLSVEEEIPWKCRRLVIGTGSGALPVMQEVRLEARRRKVELLVLSSEQAIDVLKQEPAETNAILHVTC